LKWFFVSFFQSCFCVAAHGFFCFSILICGCAFFPFSFFFPGLKPGVNQVESFQDFTTTGSNFNLEVLFNLIIFIVFKSSVSALWRMVALLFNRL